MGNTSIPKTARMISEHCNYIDPQTAQDFYTGFTRMLIAELRKNGKIVLPGWGTFRIVEHKPHTRSTFDGRRVRVNAMNTLKFVPCNMLKEYVRDKI